MSSTNNTGEETSKNKKSNVSIHQSSNKLVPPGRNNQVITNDDKSSLAAKLFEEEQQIKFQEDQQLLVKDYTQSKTVIDFDQFQQEQTNQGGELQSLQQQKYEINTQVKLQLKDNPLALQALSESKIDLKDKRINVTSLNMQDSDIVASQNINQIDLGNVVSMPKNAILLEDIDVHNIPEDKEILLEKKEKRLLAVGVKVQKNNDNTQQREQQPLEQGKTQHSEKQQKSSQQQDQDQTKTSEMVIQKKIFEEKSFAEIKDQYLFKTEADMVFFNFSEFARVLIYSLPITIFCFYFCQTLLEVYSSRSDVWLHEEQEMEVFHKIRKQFANNILLNDPRFNRTKLFSQENTANSGCC